MRLNAARRHRFPGENTALGLGSFIWQLQRACSLALGPGSGLNSVWIRIAFSMFSIDLPFDVLDVLVQELRELLGFGNENGNIWKMAHTWGSL